MIRLFVGIALSQSVRDRLALLAHGVREARWAAPENMHLTLRFIGETPENELADIAAALGALDAPPFALTLAGAGHFETRKRVRALWIGIEREPALMALQERIEAALRRVGLAPEGRKFMPHITIARLKGAPPAHVRGWLEANSLFRSEPIPVGEFTLFRSHLGHGGAHYEALQVFPLDVGTGCGAAMPSLLRDTP